MVSKPRAKLPAAHDQIIDSHGDIASHAFYFTSSRTGLVDLGANGGTMAYGNATLRSIFDRHNIVDVADLESAGKRLEEHARRRKRERAAPLKRVK
jgi:hypothetical protein